VYLDSHSIGGYSGLKWYVNGKQQTGNPADLVLKPHQEIAFVVGRPPAKIPSSYAFPAGGVGVPAAGLEPHAPASASLAMRASRRRGLRPRAPVGLDR